MKKFLLSFVNAFKGIRSGFQERNMKIHGLAAVIVIAAGLVFNLNVGEWVLVLILIGLVMAAELINTAVEELADTVRDELKLDYGATTRARDVAAGAVLVLAIIAGLIGLLLFGSKLAAELRLAGF
ncbi:MAG: diacylglycerol kinase family protein [Candidatus Pacebacteria bacterium]|nr:diacylglycerol kinase family protein [Candidatus Paceibacterota bacterium]